MELRLRLFLLSFLAGEALLVADDLLELWLRLLLRVFVIRFLGLQLSFRLLLWDGLELRLLFGLEGVLLEDLSLELDGMVAFGHRNLVRGKTVLHILLPDFYDVLAVEVVDFVHVPQAADLREFIQNLVLGLDREVLLLGLHALGSLLARRAEFIVRLADLEIVLTGLAEQRGRDCVRVFDLA